MTINMKEAYIIIGLSRRSGENTYGLSNLSPYIILARTVD